MPEEIIEVKVIPLDILTLPFNGSVERNASVVLVSQRVTFPFNIERIRVHFSLNTNKTVQIRCFVSPDSEAPVSGPPSGTNPLSPLGQVDYLVGDDETVELPYRALVDTGGYYLKIYAVNNDSYDHTVDAQVFISRV